MAESSLHDSLFSLSSLLEPSHPDPLYFTLPDFVGGNGSARRGRSSQHRTTWISRWKIQFQTNPVFRETPSFSDDGNVPRPLVAIFFLCEDIAQGLRLQPKTDYHHYQSLFPTEQNVSCSLGFNSRSTLSLQHGWMDLFNESGAERLVSSPAVLDKEQHARVVASMKNFALYSKVGACWRCVREPVVSTSTG